MSTATITTDASLSTLSKEGSTSQADIDEMQKLIRWQRTGFTIDSFWRHHPKIYLGKQIMQFCAESYFFYRDIDAIYEESDVFCETTEITETTEFGDEPTKLEKIRIGLYLMCFLHGFHIFRLLYKLFDKLRKNKKRFTGQGLFKCLLMDCYCCLASTIYFYTQQVYWRVRGDCKDVLPKIETLMRLEIFYQYGQVSFFVLTNLLVVCFMLAIRRKLTSSQTEMLKNIEA